MKQIALKVTTLSPLSIRSDHAPKGANVAPYIRGSTLMGCLASVHRLLRSNEDPEFAAFFLSDKVQYPNLYPASFKNSDMQDAFVPIYCVPHTAQSCKRFGGFRPLPGDDKQDDEDEQHGVRDSLFDWALFTLSTEQEHGATDKEIGQIIAALQELKSRRCTCGEPLDKLEGFYRWLDDGRATADPKKRLLTRTGINRKYGTVEEEILYNREVYEEGTSFFGVIHADDDVAPALQEFLQKRGVEKDSPFLLNEFARFGTGRTRGFGRVEFEMLPIENVQVADVQDRFEAFKERLRLFDEALRERAKAFTLQPFYIALTLHAPAILCDELLRYEGSISGERLAALAGLPADTFKLLYHSASVERVKGWQELWGLPRMYEYALSAGSVFFFAVTQPLDDPLAHTLFTLEEQGIGQRRAEGFGHICISDPFHREGDLQ